MGGGYDSYTDKSVMYIVYPYPTPAIMDITKARDELGWRPRYTGLEALRDTLRP